MAVYYLDPIGGNNNNNGTSFANRRKSYPSSASNAFQDGDEVRIIKSPDYTSLGNATWKAKPKGTFYSESNAAKISNCTAVKGTTTTINCPSVHGLSTGDLVEIEYNSNVDNNLVGYYEATVTSTLQFTIPSDTSNDSWTDNSTTFTINPHVKYLSVRLPAGTYVQPIALCLNQGYHNWTVQSNITHYKGTYSVNDPLQYYFQRFDVQSAFTTGKVAHYQLPSTLNLSGYQQISFRFNQYGIDGTTNSGQEYQVQEASLTLRLCSDNNGDTPVHTIDFPKFGGRNLCGFAVVKDFGTNLSTNINSVSLVINTAFADDFEFMITDIMACKASSDATSLTGNSIISKSNDNVNRTEFYKVGAVVDRHVIFMNPSSNGGGASLDRVYYSGTSETVPTYKREALNLQSAIDFGFYGYLFYIDKTNVFLNNGLTISGGWNDTDMSTQTGHSYLDGGNQNSCILFNAQYSNNIIISKVSATSMYHHFQGYSTGGSTPAHASFHVSNGTFAGANYGIRDVSSSSSSFRQSTYTNCIFLNDTSFQGNDGNFTVFDNCQFIYATYYAPNEKFPPLFKNCTMRNCDASNPDSYAGTKMFQNCTIDDENARYVTFANRNYGPPVGGDQMIFKDCSLTNVQQIGPVQVNSSWMASTLRQQDENFLSYENYNNAANDHRIYYNNAIMFSESTVRYVNSGIAWKLSPATTSYTEDKPFGPKFIESYVEAGTQVTASIWTRRTNTALTVRMAALVADNLLLGLSSDLTDTMTSGADTWEQLSFSFTPSVSGLLTVRVLVWGGSTHSAYVDAPSITQV